MGLGRNTDLDLLKKISRKKMGLSRSTDLPKKKNEAIHNNKKNEEEKIASLR